MTALQNSLMARLLASDPPAWQLQEYIDNYEAGLLRCLPGERFPQQYLGRSISFDPLCLALGSPLSPQDPSFEELALLRSRLAGLMLEHAEVADPLATPHPLFPDQPLAIHLALSAGCLDIAAQLVRQKKTSWGQVAAWQEVSPGDDWTMPSARASLPLLVSAATEGNLPVVRLLLEGGADPALADAQGNTGAHLAATAEIFDLFVQYGIGPAHVNAQGQDAYAFLGKRPDITGSLLKKMRLCWEKVHTQPLSEEAAYALLASGLAQKSKTQLQQEMRLVKHKSGTCYKGQSLAQALAFSLAEQPQAPVKPTVVELALQGANLHHTGPLGVSDALLLATAGATSQADLSEFLKAWWQLAPELELSPLEALYKVLQAAQVLPYKAEVRYGLASQALLKAIALHPGFSEFSAWELAWEDPQIDLGKRITHIPATGRNSLAFALQHFHGSSAAEERLKDQVQAHPLVAQKLLAWILEAYSVAGLPGAQNILGPNNLPTQVLAKPWLGAKETLRPRPGAVVLDLLWEEGVRLPSGPLGQRALTAAARIWPELAAPLQQSMLEQAVTPAQALPRPRM